MPDESTLWSRTDYRSRRPPSTPGGVSSRLTAQSTVTPGPAPNRSSPSYNRLLRPVTGNSVYPSFPIGGAATSGRGDSDSVCWSGGMLGQQYVTLNHALDSLPPEGGIVELLGDGPFPLSSTTVKDTLRDHSRRRASQAGGAVKSRIGKCCRGISRPAGRLVRPARLGFPLPSEQMGKTKCTALVSATDSILYVQGVPSERQPSERHRGRGLAPTAIRQRGVHSIPGEGHHKLRLDQTVIAGGRAYRGYQSSRLEGGYGNTFIEPNRTGCGTHLQNQFTGRYYYLVFKIRRSTLGSSVEGLRV